MNDSLLHANPYLFIWLVDSTSRFILGSRSPNYSVELQKSKGWPTVDCTKIGHLWLYITCCNFRLHSGAEPKKIFCSQEKSVRSKNLLAMTLLTNHEEHNRNTPFKLYRQRCSKSGRCSGCLDVTSCRECCLVPNPRRSPGLLGERSSRPCCYCFVLAWAPMLGSCPLCCPHSRWTCKYKRMLVTYGYRRKHVEFTCVYSMRWATNAMEM